MLLDTCIVSCDLNPLYLEFWPIVHKVWTKLIGIQVKLILIANEIPENLPHQEDIILFKPIPGIIDAFIAQNIRLLYPCILPSKNGIIISDMDIIPMNKSYYVDNIKSISSDKFVCYRDIFKINQYPICFNVATPKVWRGIFKVGSIDNINSTLKKWWKMASTKKKYKRGYMWGFDQEILFKKIQPHKKYFVGLKDNQTKFQRLDRIDNDITNLSSVKLKKIKRKFYSDYHMLRPLNKYEKENEIIFNTLLT